MGLAKLCLLCWAEMARGVSNQPSGIASSVTRILQSRLYNAWRKLQNLNLLSMQPLDPHPSPEPLNPQTSSYRCLLCLCRFEMHLHASKFDDNQEEHHTLFVVEKKSTSLSCHKVYITLKYWYPNKSPDPSWIFLRGFSRTRAELMSSRRA